MDDEPKTYIETPRTASRPERIDALLQKRMHDLLVKRRKKVWQKQQGRQNG